MSLIIDPYRFAVGGGAFSPLDLGDVELWLDANDLALSDTDPVSSWDDLSGNSRNANQATGALQPTYRTGIINGNPGVRFNSDGLLSNFTLSQPYTIFAVAVSTSSTANQCLVGWNTGSANLYSLSGSAGNLMKPFLYAGGTFLNYSDAISVNTTYVFSAVFNGGSSRGWRNGVSKTSGSAGSNSMAGVCVGINRLAGTPSDPLIGDIGELFIIGRAVSSTDREAAETYLADKWGITL